MVGVHQRSVVPNRKDRRRSAVYPESQRKSGSPEEAWVYSGERMRSYNDRGEVG